MTAGHGGYQPLEPTRPPSTTPQGGADANFLLWREVDRLERSIESQARRMEHLDEHGSRGVDALKGKIEQIRKDFMDHETMHAEAARLAAEAARQAVQSRRWLIGVTIALVTPLYPLIIAIFAR